MVDDPSFCLFHCESLPFAVAIEDVAEIVEMDVLVRISLCPPRIAGLCPYHRQVVPVVALGKDSCRTEPPTPEKRISGKGSRKAVLILQTDEGIWGIHIDRNGTVITPVRPSRHEPRSGEDGIVTVGLIPHGEADHALLDAGSTWRGLRELVVNWYARINESAASTRLISPAGG
jgi:chemotaxis signal transduction protein